MRLTLTEEQELLRDMARRFLEKEAPLSRIRKGHDIAGGFERDYWTQACGLGWTALAACEDKGGYSASGDMAQDCAVIAEELGRMVAAGPYVSTVAVLDALSDPTFDDTEAIVGGIISGSQVATWAYGESGNVWEPSRFTTKIVVNGGDVRLNGAKAYVEHGAEADWLLVTAVGELGLRQILVPARATGVSVVAGRSVDLVRRFAEVRFDNVTLPAGFLVGAGDAAAQVRRQERLAVLLQCAEINGAVDRAFEFTVDYMRQRNAFGRPIASYQALKHRLADAYLQLQGCMATTDAALKALSEDAPEAGELVHIAKAYVGARATEIMGELVQMTGGIAVTWDHDLHLYERRVAVNRALFGTPEAHRTAVHRIVSRRGDV